MSKTLDRKTQNAEWADAADDLTVKSSDLKTAADGGRAPAEDSAKAEQDGMIYQDDNNYLDSKSSQKAPESPVYREADTAAAPAPKPEKKRQKNLTKDDVRKARDELKAGNITVTPVSVYSRLQRGSFTTISRYLHELDQERIDTETKLKQNDINRTEVERLAGKIVELAYLGNAEKLKTEINRAHTMMSEISKGCQQKLNELCAELDKVKSKLEQAEEDKQKLLEDKARLLKQNSEQRVELQKAEAVINVQKANLKTMEGLYQKLLDRLEEKPNKSE